MWISPAVYYNNVLSTLLLSVGQLDVTLSTVGSLCLIVVLLRGTFSPVSPPCPSALNWPCQCLCSLSSSMGEPSHSAAVLRFSPRRFAVVP